MSSKPTTLTSSGTFLPRSCMARSSPTAIWSLATKTALTSGRSASASPAWYPEAGLRVALDGDQRRGRRDRRERVEGHLGRRDHHDAGDRLVAEPLDRVDDRLPVDRLEAGDAHRVA